jgi:nitric oxide reductase subunit B
MLGLSLMLFCLKIMFNKSSQWNDKTIAWGFWLLNLGLALMVLISLLPIGVIQSYYSMTKGLWYARSADLLQQDYMIVLRWLRIPGDVIFSLGATLIIYEIVKKALNLVGKSKSA